MQNSPYRLYLKNLRKHAFYYMVGSLAVLITSLSEVFLPKFIQWNLDHLTRPQVLGSVPAIFQKGNPHETLDTLILGLLVSLTIGWMGRVGWRQILARQTHLAGHDIKIQIWSVLKDQPLSILDRYSLGDLMNRSTADWNKTRFIHGFTIVLTLDLIFFSALAILSMFWIDRQIALLCLVFILFLPRRIIRLSRDEYRQHQCAQEQLSSLSDLISQTIKTIRLQRATATESVWTEKLIEESAEYARRQFEVLKTGRKIFLISTLPTLLIYAVLFTFGLYKLKQSEISFGEFIALQSYVLLLQNPLFELGPLISEWQTGFASYQRITEIYNLKGTTSLMDQHRIVSPYIPSLPFVLENLNYTYNSSKLVLENITLNVNQYDKIGILGHIGSGKSTLLNLMAGLLENPQGNLKINGIPMNACDRNWLTQQISMVTQKPFFFAGTLRHNLSPGRQLDDTQLIQVLKCVELWSDIQKFPLLLDSWIGECGINLSGGQKQRLALARALLTTGPILLIDDGLSAIDSMTEAMILQNIKPLLEYKTVIWTAHRASTLQICKRIFELRSGQLVLVKNLEKDNLPLIFSQSPIFNEG